MGLDWLEKDKKIKDHSLWGKEHWGTEPPCTMYEKRPILDAKVFTPPGSSSTIPANTIPTPLKW